MSSPGLERPSRGAALASFLANGAFAQIAQILLVRELLVVLDGDELAIGILLAAWLVWVGVGAALGARRLAAAGPVYAVVAAVAALSLPAAMVGVRMSRPFFDAPPGTPLAIPETLLLATAAAAVPCIGVGALFPLMVRLARRPAAVVYGAEAAGALIAGLLFLFVLVTRAAPLTMALGAAAVSLAAAAWVLRSRLAGRYAWSAAPAGLCVLAAIGAAFGGRLDRGLERLRWRSLLPGHTLLATRETPYGRCSLLESGGQLSLFLDGKLLFDAPDPQAAVTVVHTAMLQHPAPRSVWLAAHDPLAAVREARRHAPGSIECVILDRRPIDLLASRLPADAGGVLDAPEVRVVEADPVERLRRSTERHDVMIVDMPDPATLGLNRFYTLEFLQLLARRLAPGGVVALSISGGEHDPGAELLARNAVCFQTFRSVFPSAIASPGDPCLMLARQPADPADWPLSLDVEELESRAAHRGLQSPQYLAFLYTDPFPSGQTAMTNRALSAWPGSPGPAPVLPADGIEPSTPPPETVTRRVVSNSVRRPRLYWETRVLQARTYAPEDLPVIQALPAASRAFLTAVVTIGVFALALPRRRGGGRHTSGPGAIRLAVAVVAAGFAGMAVQVAVMLWFQMSIGQVYAAIGLLTASFMTGTALASLVGAAAPASRRALTAVQAALLLFAAALPLMLPALGAWALPAACSLSLCVGALLGAHFALCAGLWPAQGVASASAGALYSADVVGAAVAAALVAAVVIPLDGVGAACWWAAGVVLVAMAAALRLPTRRRA